MRKRLQEKNNKGETFTFKLERESESAKMEVPPTTESIMYPIVAYNDR